MTHPLACTFARSPRVMTSCGLIQDLGCHLFCLLVQPGMQQQRALLGHAQPRHRPQHHRLSHATPLRSLPALAPARAADGRPAGLDGPQRARRRSVLRTCGPPSARDGILPVAAAAAAPADPIHGRQPSVQHQPAPAGRGRPRQEGECAAAAWVVREGGCCELGASAKGCCKLGAVRGCPPSCVVLVKWRASCMSCLCAAHEGARMHACHKCRWGPARTACRGIPRLRSWSAFKALYFLFACTLHAYTPTTPSACPGGGGRRPKWRPARRCGSCCSCATRSGRCCASWAPCHGSATSTARGSCRGSGWSRRWRLCGRWRRGGWPGVAVRRLVTCCAMRAPGCARCEQAGGGHAQSSGGTMFNRRVGLLQKRAQPA